MPPYLTLHAGEYLEGSYVEQYRAAMLGSQGLEEGKTDPLVRENERIAPERDFSGVE